MQASKYFFNCFFCFVFVFLTLKGQTLKYLKVDMDGHDWVVPQSVSTCISWLVD